MRQELREAYVARIATEMTQVLTGNNFERFGYLISDQVYSDYELRHRGTTLAGAPVGHVVDSFSICGEAVAEYSTEESYFSKIDKIDKDTQHAVEHYRDSLKKLLLLSNRQCNPSQQKAVTKYILEIKDAIGLEIIIWDARKIAEYIVDDLLFDDVLAERISYFLPSVKTIRFESALNFTLPKIDKTYQHRAGIEGEISSKLLKGSSCVIVGFGGMGKSSISSAIANSIKSEFDITVWLDASELQDINQLGSFDVCRNGHQINLNGLLKSKKTLLVLDNLAAPLSQSQLEELCSKDSVILASRRNVVDLNDLELPLLDETTAKCILEFEIGDSCPDSVFQKVFSTVGGYPLIYALMNANIRESEYEWADIESDCEAISEYEDEMHQKLTERLIGHLLSSLSTQLSFLKACKAKVIDYNFAKATLKPIGIKKLVSSTILSKSNLGFLRVHDVIFEAISNMNIESLNIETSLKEYLEKSENNNWATFLRVSHWHNELIYNTYKNTKESIYLYSHLIASVPATLIKAEISSPTEIYDDINKNLPSVDRIQVSALIELIESIYLLNKESSIDNARIELEKVSSIFSDLIGIVHEDIELTKMVRHHYAKCLLRLEKEPEAEAEFNKLVDEDPSMYEVKLQLARIYARTDRAPRTKQIIEEILNAWQSESGPSISVALAAFELVSRNSLKEYKQDLNAQYSDLIASIIKEAMAFGYDHSYRAFSIFAGDWAYNHPEKFIATFDYLPFPPVSSIKDDGTKNSIADLYREAGKVHLRECSGKAQYLFDMAIDFYSAVEKKNPFYQRRLAEALYLGKRYDDSISICNSIIEQSDRDPYVFFWLAKAQLSLENLPEAKEKIGIALSKLPDNQKCFSSSFLEVKSDILRAMGEGDFVDFLQEAIECCNSKKYRIQLEEKLRELTDKSRNEK
ncbi:MAG: tetratricopeptide repeat protein [Pseudoalteromonas prydzensis]|uniref:tetratricopeptide repeat protein n=1 Tax=Pseudoalteromonas prydzensis TaxID=182141 RepID=UPI003F9C1A7F